MAIQKIRFGDRLQFKVSIDPGLHSQSIIKLILQPLVENALIHGFEGKGGRWNIKIQAVVQDDCLLIKVLDNGMGMSGEQIASLNAKLQGAGSSSANDESWGQGIGLANIHKRIQIYYGPSYGLSITSWAGKGTIITIKIPLRTKEDSDV